MSSFVIPYNDGCRLLKEFDREARKNSGAGALVGGAPQPMSKKPKQNHNYRFHIVDLFVKASHDL